MRTFLAGILLLATAGVLSAADQKSALDKQTLESYLRYMLMWGPQISMTISDPVPGEVPGTKQVTVHGAAGGATVDYVFLVSDDGQKIVQGSVFDVNRNPFQNDLDKLSTDGAPSRGTKGAPVQIVIFSDFECPYCKQETDELQAHLLSTYPTQVEVFYKDFPLVQVHDWAMDAAIAGRCIYNQSQDAFWQYHDYVYANQTSLNKANLREKIVAFGDGKFDTLQFGQCFDSRATAADVNRSVAQAMALQVNATPTLFINGRRINAQPWENLKQIIDFELQNRSAFPAPAAAAPAEDDCCSISLPTPTGN